MNSPDSPQTESASDRPEDPADRGASLLIDPELSALLSRLAALQRRAMPAHRFGMVSETADGLALADLQRADRAEAMWGAAFPQAIIRRVSDAPGEPVRAPYLWLAADGATVHVIRAGLADGRLVAETAQRERLELTPEVAAQGLVLELRVEPDEQAAPAQPEHKGALAYFWHAIRLRKRIFIEAVLATTLISLIGLGSALYTMQVYDRVLPSEGYSTLIVLTVGVLIAIVLELVMKQVRSTMVDRTCKVIDQQLAGFFFGRALAIRMDARPRTVGTFASQIRQFETVRNFLTSSTLFVIADLPFALLFVAVIAIIAGPIALIPLSFIPMAALVALMFKGSLARLTEANMVESNQKSGLLIESIDGAESVKAARGEWKMLDRWQQLTSIVSDSELGIRARQVGAANLTQAIQQLCYVGLVATGVYYIGKGELTMGGLIACTIISGRALQPFGQVSGFIVQWQMAKAALKGLDQLVSLPGDGSGSERLLIPDDCVANIELVEAKFSYPDGRVGLEVPRLQFQPGERVAILGSVGSGKSTLIKVLSGLYRLSDGRAVLDGNDMALLAPEFVREHIGYLPQDVRLFQGTVRDNLTLGLDSPSDSQVLAASRLTGLDAAVASHPKGFHLEIAEGGRGLSGGQRQLVGLTRLLIAQPRVLLLDEPTASMDAQMELRVMSALFENLHPKGLAVVVTHKVAMLQHVTRVIVMDRGRIAMDGPRDAVMEALRKGAQPAARKDAAVPAATVQMPSTSDRQRNHGAA